MDVFVSSQPIGEALLTGYSVWDVVTLAQVLSPHLRQPAPRSLFMTRSRECQSRPFITNSSLMIACASDTLTRRRRLKRVV